jgi:hypothetical protein
MPSEAGPFGRIHYTREGFCVSWNREGLEVKVTDYHAGVLHLSWATLLDLAGKAMVDSHAAATAAAPVEEKARSFRPEKI